MKKVAKLDFGGLPGGFHPLKTGKKSYNIFPFVFFGACESSIKTTGW